MNLEAMSARMSVLTRAIPRRILLVDDDELDQELLACRLSNAGFEVARAANGSEALELIGRHWFPLVITDWQMPVMDGIAFTQTLRERGLEDTYVIMLSMRDSEFDYERGYVSGVDDYLPKTAPDVELFARIYAAFNTLALRRSLQQAKEALEQAAAIDPDSGAFAHRELLTRLHAEIRRAQRYGRNLSVLMVKVRGVSQHAASEPAVLRGLMETVLSILRAHVDWIGRWEASSGAVFAVVLPEASATDAPTIKDRVLNGLCQRRSSLGVQLEFDVGVASLDRSVADGALVEVEDMLETASLCAGCPGRAGEEQLRAVQRSVAGRLALVCRRGFFVDGECTLKALPAGVDDQNRPG